MSVCVWIRSIRIVWGNLIHYHYWLFSLFGSSILHTVLKRKQNYKHKYEVSHLIIEKTCELSKQWQLSSLQCIYFGSSHNYPSTCRLKFHWQYKMCIFSVVMLGKFVFQWDWLTWEAFAQDIIFNAHSTQAHWKGNIWLKISLHKTSFRMYVIDYTSLLSDDVW